MLVKKAFDIFIKHKRKASIILGTFVCLITNYIFAFSFLSSIILGFITLCITITIANSYQNNSPPLSPQRDILEELLEEVFRGNYQNFRDHLSKTHITHLKLRGKIKHKTSIELTHLAIALHGTTVISLDIASNKIDSAGIRTFISELKGTLIRRIDLSWNSIGTEALGDVFNETNIREVNIEQNSLGNEGAIAFVETLKGSNIRKINIRSNHISSEGLIVFGNALKNTAVREVDINTKKHSNAKDFIEAFKGIQINQLKFDDNTDFKTMSEIIKGTNVKAVEFYNIEITSNAVAKALGKMFKKTNVTKISLFECGRDYERRYWSDRGLDQDRLESFVLALKNTNVMVVELRQSNGSVIFPESKILEYIQDTCICEITGDIIVPQKLKEKLSERCNLLSSYYRLVSFLQNIPEDKKYNSLNLNIISDESSREEKMNYAKGILVNLPEELVIHTLSFLPLMNSQRAKDYIQAAKKDNAPIISSRYDLK